MSDLKCEKCPTCFKAPESWTERPAHGSRELFWMGCRQDGHLAGGVSKQTALQSWNRLSYRWAFTHGGISHA